MDFIKTFGCNCQNQNQAQCQKQCHNQCQNQCRSSSPCENMQETDCNKFETYDTLHDMPLAMAYVPWQQWKNVYDGAKGLQSGTIFEELIFPFHFASPACRDNNNGCGCGYERRCNQR